MPATIDSPSPHHALIALEPDVRDEPAHRLAPHGAPFLTHLIATARQLPQARARRRAEPADAITAYREAIRRLGTR